MGSFPRIAIALTALICLAAPAAATARVPQGFIGVMGDGPLAEPPFDPAPEMDGMVAGGVESLRLVVHWTDAQPYRDLASVPEAERSRFRDVGGTPTDFARYDRLVGAAAARGIRLLVVVTTAPAWGAKYPGDFASPPASPSQYAAFVRAVVARYGSRGAFWRENPSVPRRPIRRWQLWNEPNLRSSWTDARWAAPYVSLLRAGRRAVEAADPRSRVVLAGLPNVSWRDLGAIYRVRGSRRLFDEVAIHPYTRDVSGVLTVLRNVRRVMNRNGDRRKRIAVTEFGWPSAEGKADGFGIETTEAGQARRAAQALRALARQRERLRLSSVFWHNWIGREGTSESIWPYSGLRRQEPDGTVVSKPALRSFRAAALRLEGCRRKASVATRCAVRRR